MCALVTGVQTCALPIYHNPLILTPCNPRRICGINERRLTKFHRAGRRGRVTNSNRSHPSRSELRCRRRPGPLSFPQSRGRLRLQSIGRRSEEHTSELQSLMRTSYAVFCLKKKKDMVTRTSKKRNEHASIQ